MDKKVIDYIKKQPRDRQELLAAIHDIIVENDKTVVSIVEPMMGKEMIVYKGKGLMKYGLSSVKNYMSLHVMPIYGSAKLHSKYKSLLDKADFQKGCINFDSADKMPLEIVKQLFNECSGIDLMKFKEQYLADKKLNKKSKP